MADHILWIQTELTIPQDKMIDAAKAFDIELEAEDAIVEALEEDGFEVETTDNGSILFCGQSWEHDDEDGIEADPTLKSLIGIFAPGSFITGFDDNGTYWQLRYSEKGREMVYGIVTFPRDPAHEYLVELETA